jgi:3-oxoacyl-[acyl-carrier protein] reductase
MDFGLWGKTALITASSSGIGKQCALALALEGANVVISGRDEAKLAAAQEEVEVRAASAHGAHGRHGVHVHAQRADLASAADTEALCAAAEKRFGHVDILVYIGGSPKRGGSADISEDDLVKAFEITVLPAFRLTRRLLPGMRSRGWGRVVTVQSRAVREPIPQLLTSVATRPGVAGLFKYLADECGHDGVTINTVVPGRIDTDRFRQGAALAEDRESYVQQKLGQIPVGRLGRPREIADAVCFLASVPASYIHGASLQVDGGVIRAI